MKALKTLAAFSVGTMLALMVSGVASAQTTSVPYSSNNTFTSTTSSSGGTTNVNSTSGNATTNTSGTMTGSSSTPGVPNTGAGGDVVTNIFLLATSAAVALIGLAYLSRRWAQ